MDTKEIEAIANKIYENFIDELTILKKDIISMISLQFKSINNNLNDYNKKLEKQQKILNEHSTKLNKHDKIFENHMEILTNVTKDLNEIKDYSKPKIKIKLWIKILIGMGITFLLSNTIVLIINILFYIKNLKG